MFNMFAAFRENRVPFYIEKLGNNSSCCCCPAVVINVIIAHIAVLLRSTFQVTGAYVAALLLRNRQKQIYSLSSGPVT